MLDFEEIAYPTLESADRANGTPIPFGSLSGLSYSASDGLIYSIDDSFYRVNRAFAINATQTPPTIVAEYFVSDMNDVFGSFLRNLGLTAVLDDLIRDDNGLNVDFEGISASADGGFWAVHQGEGSTGVDFETPNLLFKFDSEFVIVDVISLPDEVNAGQTDFGLKGVAEDGDGARVVVVFELPLQTESDPRICAYDTGSSSWECYFYVVDAVESQNGGYVGLSDIVSIGDGYFYVIERDNGYGFDAAVKRVYVVDMSTPLTELQTLEKALKFDMLVTLEMATNGPIVEKVDGLTMTPNGDVWILNDNDGLRDNSGETLFLNLGDLGGCSPLCVLL